MSFYTSLSGLQGAQTELSTIAHNLANVSTNGFKRSRVEFGDVIASTAARNTGSSCISDCPMPSHCAPCPQNTNARIANRRCGRDPHDTPRCGRPAM